MGKHKRLTLIEILLILAIIAVLVLWLFPRFLRMLDSNSPAVGIVKPYIGDASETGGLRSRSSYEPKLSDLLDRIIGNSIS
jgi:hypothetical protein